MLAILKKSEQYSLWLHLTEAWLSSSCVAAYDLSAALPGVTELINKEYLEQFSLMF